MILNANAQLKEGYELHRRGMLAEAIHEYRSVLRRAPADLGALYLLALATLQRDDLTESETLLTRALAIEPDHAPAHCLLGMVHDRAGRFDEGLASFDRCLAIDPNDAQGLRLRAGALHKLKRFDEALTTYDRALIGNPRDADTMNDRGSTLAELKRFEEALESYDRALATKSDHTEAHYNRGVVLHRLGRIEEALKSYDRALSIKSKYLEAWLNRGAVLHALGRLKEALESYDFALAIEPNHVDGLRDRGMVLGALTRFAEALESYDRVLAIELNDDVALNGRGTVLRGLGRFEEALESYDHALAIKPDHIYALSGSAASAMRICAWSRTVRLGEKITSQVIRSASVVTPFTFLGYGDDPALQLQCAKTYIKDKLSIPPLPFPVRKPRQHGKPRIAYLSADFHKHATSYLIAELFERHDRSHFEVVGISFGPDDGSEIRARLIKAFDRFHDVRSLNDHGVAKLLYELEIDIAVDLKGHTQDARLGILACRPSPIQVSYLGFPGTTGADFIDYVIGDDIVLPFDQQAFWSEKIVHLPECYQVNDSKRKIADRTPTREEAGLPEKGFVFCCFNNNYKITPPFFDIWMRLLGKIESSVLWLRRDNVSAERNLRQEALARGIDPARLIFADVRANEEHLARHKLADLFLDTLPVNAHTTASDALWAGLPVLTCLGKSFAGRVAASLLHAVGLPEVVTRGLDEYEALALKLASDASLLRKYRTRLERNRATAPLFDIERFRRHLEDAYLTMLALHQKGEQPRSFSVRRI